MCPFRQDIYTVLPEMISTADSIEVKIQSNLLRSAQARPTNNSRHDGYGRD